MLSSEENLLVDTWVDFLLIPNMKKWINLALFSNDRSLFSSQVSRTLSSRWHVRISRKCSWRKLYLLWNTFTQFTFESETEIERACMKGKTEGALIWTDLNLFLAQWTLSDMFLLFLSIGNKDSQTIKR